MAQYDLEDRTERFSLEVIKFCKTLPQNTITRPLISQLIRAATSVGANYCEANGANSKKDFASKIYICKKESKEARYWLRLIAKSEEQYREAADGLAEEAQELVLIFGKIASSSH